MLTLPTEIMPVLGAFAPVFSERVWDWVQVLVIGAILAPGKRTVSVVLTIVGQRDDEQYQNYHRVLNRAVWSSLEISQILLGLLVAAFSAAGVPVVGPPMRPWSGGRVRRFRTKACIAMRSGRVRNRS